ncbi:MAG TPA: type IV secretion system DNA-binding domain-containing protein, partial [Steroidobacteraceae bacterium]|nr:type IV secretion system DNA-binding domain-containing protein [Steroidobacteraceae bacterium]
SLTGGLGSLILPLLAVGVGIVVLLKVPMLRRLFFRTVNLLPALLLYLVGCLALPLWWLANLLVGRLLRIVPLDALGGRALEWLGQHLPGGRTVLQAALLRGDRLGAAQLLWPKASHPDLYSEVPRDVLRPPYDDGRLIGGLRLHWLADRHLTESVFRSAVRVAVTTTLLAFVAFTVLYLLSALGSIGHAFAQLKGGGRLFAEQWPGQKPEGVPTWWIVSASLKVIGPTLARALGSLGTFLPGCALACGGLGLLTMLLLISTRQRETAAPYEWQSKDADVRWAYRSETRNLIRSTYRQQVLHATGYLRDKPCYQVGDATGTLRARGDLAAPMPGQGLALDEESLFQHLLVFGGTGEGKTTALLKPLVRQLLAQPSYGLYVCDAKGVLWTDVQGIIAKVRPNAEVVTIGTGPDQFGVNVLAGLTPTQVAGTLRSVMAQLGGGSGDSFWPDMAANVLRNVFSLARAYGMTEAGLAAANRSGMAPYSLWWAYQAVLRPELIGEATQALRDFFKAAPEQLKALAEGSPERASFAQRQQQITSKEVYDSMAYLESTWRDMAKETKSGIVANVTQLLDGFAGTRVLRERFACGSNRNAISIAEALKGKVVLNALSSIEDGLPARIVSVLLKTNLYREARRRESAYRRGQSPVKPQSQPCIVLMDEIQELVTADVSSGLSDATFWNVARSTGVAGVFATQTVAALQQAIGPEAAMNFMQQARSKVFFRTEDRETVEYACWCAGKYERNRVYDDGHRESIEFRGLIDGWDPLAPLDPDAALVGGWRLFFQAAKALLNPERFMVGQPATARAYAVDRTYVPSPTGGEGGDTATLQAMQAAAWRAEDLERDYRKSGNELTEALTPADLIHMGRWHAFAQLQRAGAVRQDIVAVHHDFE